MRFHVVGLPNTRTKKDFLGCAFTMKIYNFCKMMNGLGHEVFHYGSEGSELDGYATDVPILSYDEQEKLFSMDGAARIYNIDWSGRASYWALLNVRAAAEITKRKQSGDFVCVISGSNNRALSGLLGNDVAVVEYGIGYNGVFAKYRVYESYAHMHKVWGAEGGYDPDGKNYDVVIPHFFDTSDYPFCAQSKNYFLFIGRLIKRKGIRIAVEACRQLGMPLKIAGYGCKSFDNHRLTCEDGSVYEYDQMEYVGFVTDPADRAKLFGEAIATFMPTEYIEPGGYVAVESQLTGTPVIATDWGTFTETIEHGKTGFRCRTLDHFVFAGKQAASLDREYIHRRAVSKYSMDRLSRRYEEYFQMLSDLRGEGWMAKRDRTQLDWLKEEYP